MNLKSPPLFALLALACGRETPISNSITMPDPSPLAMVLAPGNGLQARSLRVTGGYLFLEGCASGTGASLFLGEQTNLAGMQTSLMGGNWCGLTVALGETATLKAITHSGHWLEAPVGGTEIVLGNADGVSVSGQSFILEIGAPGWLDAEGLGMTEGHRTLTTGEPELEQILLALREGTALYEDLDRNGVLGTNERSEVRAASVAEPAEDTGQADTGQPDTGGPDTSTPDSGG
jgi:hypothetical protein